MRERETTEAAQEEERTADPETWRKEDASCVVKEDIWRDIVPSWRVVTEEGIQDPDHNHQEEETEETNQEETEERPAIAPQDQEAEEVEEVEVKEVTAKTQKSEPIPTNSNKKPKINDKTFTLTS